MAHCTQRLTSISIRSGPLKLRSRGGCVLCKLRKRKCDEKKPTCDYCQERGTECVWLTHASSREKLERLKAQGKRFEVHIMSGYDTAPTVQEGQIAPWLRPDTSNVRVSYLLAKLFTGANTPCSGAGMHPLTVYTELQFADETGSLTWYVLDAMATVFWGMMQHDHEVTLQGLHARGACLARLGSALSQKPSSFTGDLVAAVALARSFEHMLPGAEFGWLGHSLGMARIFVAIGPEAFQNPAMLRLIENNRWPMIMASAILRKPSAMEKKEWKTVPWQRVQRKDILQRLLDVYADMPGIHAVWDIYSESSNADQSLVTKDDVCSRVQDVVRALQEWRLSVDTEITDSVRVWDPTGDTTPCPWQGAVSFSQAHHAYAIALYNTMIIILAKYSVALEISEPGPKCSDPNTEEQLLHGSHLRWTDFSNMSAYAADEVAMVMPWLMQERLRGAGALYLSGPATVCKTLLQQTEPVKSAWFGEMLQQMQSCWSSIVAKNQTYLRKDQRIAQ